MTCPAWQGYEQLSRALSPGQQGPEPTCQMHAGCQVMCRGAEVPTLPTLGPFLPLALNTSSLCLCCYFQAGKLLFTS